MYVKTIVIREIFFYIQCFQKYIILKSSLCRKKIPHYLLPYIFALHLIQIRLPMDR